MHIKPGVMTQESYSHITWQQRTRLSGLVRLCSGTAVLEASSRLCLSRTFSLCRLGCMLAEAP